MEISTVDGFQGWEKDIIIISMVWSNHGCNVGFLQNERRMNVAVTWARKLCIIICDSDSVSSNNEFLKGLTEYFKANGRVRSA